MHVWILLLELWPGPSDSVHFQSLSCVATEIYSFLKVISSLPPSCLPRSPTAVGSWGCQCTCILLPVLAEKVGLEEFTGLVACGSRRNSALHHHVQMFGGYGLPCPWGTVGSVTLCSRPALVIAALLSADSSCRDQWKTSWVANLFSSLWAFQCFLDSNVLMYKAVAPAVFAGLDKSRNACTLYLYL